MHHARPTVLDQEPARYGASSTPGKLLQFPSARADCAEERRSHDDWAAVLDQLLQGDRQAFAKLRRLVTASLVRLRAYDFQSEWDDAIQEVLFSAVQAARAGRLRHSPEVTAYICVATRNRFIDWLRRHRRHGPAIDTDGPGSTETPAAVPGCAHSEPHEVWQFLRRLPEKQRMAVHAVCVMGQTYDEAASDTGLPLGSLKRHLRAGVINLRRRLAAEL